MKTELDELIDRLKKEVADEVTENLRVNMPFWLQQWFDQKQQSC